MDIGLNQALALRKRMLINAYRTGAMKGAFWAINTPISKYGDRATVLHVSAAKTADLSSIRTRLDRFKEQEQCELINWGYAVSDAAVRAHAPEVVKRESEASLPYSRYPLG
ncbi:hypothetical protein D3C78_1694420 [compost metagenome]